ncbi:MAG: M48 family metallopeptidase [Verrucomicrobia bacterium]|nr:M48 family metallopeptidase [Verrucomicrobiota bacterium]
MRIERCDSLSKALVLAAALTLSGCVTSSETGRSHLELMSHGEETSLGLQSFQDIKKQTPISKDAAANAMVQRVGQRIAAVAQMDGAQWEFVLFESKEPNAFCLPGGKVGVYSGILPITKDDAGLAAVLGHEIAHATQHHGNERISRSMALNGLGSLVGLSMSASGASPRTMALFQNLYTPGVQIGTELPHSRTQESEADLVGLRYMARAGYNPEASLAFWQRFAEFNSKSGGGGTLFFLRTHPTDAQRIAQIQAALPAAKAEYRPR